MVQTVNAGTETAVKAEDLAVDQRRQRQVVEEVGEVLPHVSVAVLAQTLVIETIYLSGRGGGRWVSVSGSGSGGGGG